MYKIIKFSDRGNLIRERTSIDNYAKDGGPGEVRRLCSFTMSLWTLELKQTVNKSAISGHTALKLGEQSPKSYLKITCEFQLHILPNEEVCAAKDWLKLHQVQIAPSPPSLA